MDISNSQPYFVATLFNPTEEIENTINKYLGREIVEYIKSENFKQYEDCKLYTSLVSTGKFYSFMEERFKENQIPYEERKDLKQQLFVVFFGKILAYKYSKAAALFKETFPNVQRLLNRIKRRGYNCLAILMQRIESHTILDRVAKEVNKEIPDVAFLTRHDSIMPFNMSNNSNPHIWKIRKIMVDTIYQVTGVMPQGRISRDIRNDQIAWGDYQ